MTESIALETPRHDWNDVFPEKVLSARQLNVGYENANEIWDVRTERGPYIVKIPRAVAGRPKHPFWYGLFKLFGLHVFVDIESLKPLADFIHARTPLHVPYVRRVDTSGEKIPKPYTIVEQVRGEAAELVGGRAADIARGIGAHLGSLHQARFDYWGVFEGDQKLACGEWPSRLATALGELGQRDIPDGAKARAGLPAMQRAAQALPVPEAFTLVFPDLRASQFLQQDGKLVALVDIDSIVIGPRELDLIAAEYMLPRELVPPFVEGYTKFLPLPKLAGVRELYRSLWFLVWVLGENDYEKWMKHDAWFD
ncbi:MAG: aminoglycoside phosphotransferase family protein [Burkholderiaceae bacterium]